MQFSPSETRTITARTGLTWSLATSRSAHPSTCSGQNDATSAAMHRDASDEARRSIRAIARDRWHGVREGNPNSKVKKIKVKEKNMKSRSCLLSVVPMLLCAMAFAQSDQKSEAQKSSAGPVPSDAQKSFTTMKSLAGEWEGPVTVPEMPQMPDGKPSLVSRLV